MFLNGLSNCKQLVFMQRKLYVCMIQIKQNL